VTQSHVITYSVGVTAGIREPSWLGGFK